jgi:hypothetical protein
MDWSFLSHDANLDIKISNRSQDVRSYAEHIEVITRWFMGDSVSRIVAHHEQYLCTPGAYPAHGGYKLKLRAVVAYLDSHGVKLDEFDRSTLFTYGRRYRAVESVLMRESAVIALAISEAKSAMARRLVHIRAFIKSGERAGPLHARTTNDEVVAELNLPIDGAVRLQAAAYVTWRADHITTGGFADRMECAFAFVRESGCCVRDAVTSRILREDLRPWREFENAICIGFVPLHYGIEAQVVFYAKIACAELVERIAPAYFGPEFIDAATLLEVRERSARAAMETVAMAQLHHECAIPLDLVNLIVGYVHPWRGIAPKMKLTPEQQVEQAAFEARHG